MLQREEATYHLVSSIWDLVLMKSYLKTRFYNIFSRCIPSFIHWIYFYRLIFLHCKNKKIKKRTVCDIDVRADISSRVKYLKETNKKNQRTFFFTRKTRLLNMFTHVLNSTNYKYEQSCLPREINSICNVKPSTILYFFYDCFYFLFVCLPLVICFFKQYSNSFLFNSCRKCGTFNILYKVEYLPTRIPDFKGSDRKI